MPGAEDMNQRSSSLFVAAAGAGLYPAVAAGHGIRMVAQADSGKHEIASHILIFISTVS